MERLAVRSEAATAKRGSPGRGDALGRNALSDGLGDPLARPVQMDVGGTSAAAPAAVAADGVSGASSGVPHHDEIQGSFGHHDISGAKSQVGGPATQAAGKLGANAYATGGRMGFSTQPDLHTAAHEAAHYVQQQRGVQLYGGVGRAGDPYERHADAVADAVVEGRSAEGLLDAHPGTGPETHGVQRELKRSTTDKVSLALEGPAFAVPGLKWNIKAEGEREVESEPMGGKPETAVKATVAGGLKYDLWCLEVGVDLQADIEVKVEGNESTQAALQRGVTEFARWYAASKLGDVADKRLELAGAFQLTRQEVLGSYQELRDLLKNNSFNDFKNGATSWFYFATSPRQRVSAAIDAFHDDIQELFDLVQASSQAKSAALLFVDKAALLNEFAAAANTDQAQAAKSIDRSSGKFLSKFDPAKAQLLGAFDGVDKVKMLERDPQVQFTGTFGANLSGKLGWGGDGEDENPNEVEASVGAGKRVQSGDEQFFQLGTQDVLRGKLGVKLGKWAGEAKAEREKQNLEAGATKTKWKLELEVKREGKLNEEEAEETVDALEDGVKGVKEIGALAEAGTVPDALEALKDGATPAVEGATTLALEGGGEVTLGGEIGLEYEKASAQARAQRTKVEGKVAVGGIAGGKVALDLGKAASKLAKVEGSKQKGVKLSKTFGG